MTPTELADQLDAVIPRCATWPPTIYDATDPEERRKLCEWLAGIMVTVADRIAAEKPKVEPYAVVGSISRLTREADGKRVCVACGQSITIDQQAAWVYWGWRHVLRCPETALFAPESDETPEEVPEPPGNLWPPPAKGTHESDLFGDDPDAHFKGGRRYVGDDWFTKHPDEVLKGGLVERNAARDWSRSR